MEGSNKTIDRLRFLAEKLSEMMSDTCAGSELWVDDYDGEAIECDGHCLAEDLSNTVDELRFLIDGSK